MTLVIDVEANSLVNPTKIWVIVCKDVDTGETHIFRKVSDDAEQKRAARELLGRASRVVGHNILGYDLHVLDVCAGISIPHSKCLDTLIVSKLVDYSRKGHSIEDYGEEFGLPKLIYAENGEKLGQWFFNQYSEELEKYCVRDVEICHRIYSKYSRVNHDECWRSSLCDEHRFQNRVNELHTNGFALNVPRAKVLLGKITKELDEIDVQIKEAFPPQEVLIREFTPRATKYGTIAKTSIPRLLWDRISDYQLGVTYRHTRMVDFNPASHKQLLGVLRDAGWRPVDKTGAHIECERELNRLKYTHEPDKDDKLIELTTKLTEFQKTGWKVNENNLSTLPETAPAPARMLAKRILLESRRRSLVEWLGLVKEDGRIHGKFYGIGAWTHRMAHQNPNTANIPTSTQLDGSPKLYGKEMRSLWCAPKNRLLVGVDAEGIQLRIFAHYIDDQEFTAALVRGRKDDKTDPHSLNQRILGGVCKSRAAAKRFIYALLLGGGIGKLSQILETDIERTKEALDRLLERYAGFARLKQEIIPADARRGWFQGLDGRKVAIPGATVGERKHLCMSGYLQNGEAIVMKRACLLWHDRLSKEEGLGTWKFVNMVHDEWQTECANNMDIALRIARIQADSLRIVGEELKLKCPLAGSYYNDDTRDYTIGTNWYATH